MLDIVSGRELPGNGPDWHALRLEPLPLELFDGVSVDMARLIQSMLALERDARPTAADLLNHPRFQRIGRRRRLWTLATRPYATVAVVFGFFFHLLMSLVTSVMVMIIPAEKEPQSEPRRPRVSSPPGMALGGRSFVDALGPESSEPVRTRLVFDESATGGEQPIFLSLSLIPACPTLSSFGVTVRLSCSWHILVDVAPQSSNPRRSTVYIDAWSRPCANGRLELRSSLYVHNPPLHCHTATPICSASRWLDCS
jgi:hypothetical protein